MLGFNATQTLPTTFQANWYANNFLWLRADLGVTVSTGVSQWNDQSGSGTSNAVQAVGSKQPTVNVTDAAYNNQHTLSFAAASVQVLTIATAINQAFTCYFVGESTSGATQQQLLGSPVSNVALYINSNNWAMFAGSGFSSSNSTRSPAVFCGVFNTTTSALYINNHTTAVASGNVGSSNDVSFDIGGQSASNTLNGKIAETAFYTGAHSAAQRLEIFQYLGAKYNIVVT